MLQQNQRTGIKENPDISARNQHEWGDKTEQSDQEEKDEWGRLTVLSIPPGSRLGSACLTQILPCPDQPEGESR